MASATLPFWDPGGAGAITYLDPGNTPGLAGGVYYKGGIESLLPNVGVLNDLGEQWAWDVIYLGSKRVPGLADVKARRKHRVASSEANGMDNSNLISLGYSPAEVAIKIRLWTPQQLDDFQLTLQEILPVPGKAAIRPAALQVQHPALKLLHVQLLFVTEVSAPEKSGIPQVWEATITATDLRPIREVGTQKPLLDHVGASGQQKASDKPAAKRTPAQNQGPTVGQR